MTQKRTIKICRGNSFALKIDVEQLHTRGGITSPEDFDLTSCKEVKVFVKSRSRTTQADIDYEGKHLTILGNANYEVGLYDLELKCIDEDGKDLLFSESNVFSIVANSKDADLPAGVEFNVDVFYLG